jgi:hypothetical protein
VVNNADSARSARTACIANAHPQSGAHMLTHSACFCMYACACKLISMILQAQGRCKVGAQTRTRREIWTKDKGERDRDSMTILDAREAALQAEGMRGTRARTFAITCRKTSGNLLSQDLTALGLGSTCTRKEKGSGRERERERERKGESEDATGPDVCADILIDGLNPAS